MSFRDVINCETFRIRTGEVDEIVVDRGFVVVSLHGVLRLNPIAEPEHGGNLVAFRGDHLFMGLDDEEPPAIVDGMVRELGAWAGLGRHIPGERTWANWSHLFELNDQHDGRFALISHIDRTQSAFENSMWGSRFQTDDRATERQSRFLPGIQAYEKVGEDTDDVVWAGASIILLPEDESIKISHNPATLFPEANKVRVVYKPETEVGLVFEPCD